MSDLKLFKLTLDHITDLTVFSMALEKSLQTLIEKNIDTFFATHYGFTAEEFEFIINYDIKYRMGLGGGSAEEDEE